MVGWAHSSNHPPAQLALGRDNWETQSPSSFSSSSPQISHLVMLWWPHDPKALSSLQISHLVMAGGEEQILSYIVYVINYIFNNVKQQWSSKNGHIRTPSHQLEDRQDWRKVSLRLDGILVLFLCFFKAIWLLTFIPRHKSHKWASCATCWYVEWTASWLWMLWGPINQCTALKVKVKINEKNL